MEGKEVLKGLERISLTIGVVSIVVFFASFFVMIWIGFWLGFKLLISGILGILIHKFIQEVITKTRNEIKPNN